MTPFPGSPRVGPTAKASITAVVNAGPWGRPLRGAGYGRRRGWRLAALGPPPAAVGRRRRDVRATDGRGGRGVCLPPSRWGTMGRLLPPSSSLHHRGLLGRRSAGSGATASALPARAAGLADVGGDLPAPPGRGAAPRNASRRRELHPADPLSRPQRRPRIWVFSGRGSQRHGRGPSAVGQRRSGRGIAPRPPSPSGSGFLWRGRPSARFPWRIQIRIGHGRIRHGRGPSAMGRRRAGRGSAPRPPWPSASAGFLRRGRPSARFPGPARDFRVRGCWRTLPSARSLFERSWRRLWWRLRRRRLHRSLRSSERRL